MNRNTRKADKRKPGRAARHHPYAPKSSAPIQDTDLKEEASCYLFLDFLHAFKKANPRRKSVKKTVDEGIKNWAGLNQESRELYVRSINRVESSKHSKKPFQHKKRKSGACGEPKKGKGKPTKRFGQNRKKKPQANRPTCVPPPDTI